MSLWDDYPHTYRQKEVQSILTAVQAGECVSVVGLSGAGKSNLMGFMAHRADAFPQPNALVDCNRLRDKTLDALLCLMRNALGDRQSVTDEWAALDAVINRRLAEVGGSLCLLLDRFDSLAGIINPEVSSNLRALRDAHKYQLCYVTATRRPLEPHTELAELFYAHTLWMGPLSLEDVRWNVRRYALRVGQNWDEGIADAMLEITWGYPSLLRAVCEAYASGANLDLAELQGHPAVIHRLDEFWNDSPPDSALHESGLVGLPILEKRVRLDHFDTSQLTAKELLLLDYLQAHPGEVCTKDDLIRAVWPEDRIYESGIRDDSLAQLVRRLRIKIEPSPSEPQYIHTVPGRGYKYTPL